MWLPEPPVEPPQSPPEELPPLPESSPQSPPEDPPLLSVEPLLSGVLEPLSVVPPVVPPSVLPLLSGVVPAFPFVVPVLPEEVPPLEPAASWAARSAAARCSAMVSCWACAISAVTSELRLAV